jgi:hypothetical protein
MVEVEFKQTPLAILHCKTVVPADNPVIVDIGLFGEVTTPLPEMILHVPTPTVGVLPANVVLPLLTHMVCETPALAIVGTSSTFMFVVANEDVQTPLLIIHCKVVVPTLIPVMVVVGELGEVIVPLPATILQVPVPTNGVLPETVVLGVLTHIVCDTGLVITAALGTSSTCIVVVANEDVQTPLLIIHCNVVVPTLIPVMVVVGELGEVIVPLPAIILQVPTPTVGALPDIVVLGVLTQIVCDTGLVITAALGTSSTCIVVVASDEVQTPLLIIHCKVVVPTLMPVMVVVGEFGEVMVPLPAIILQVPTPTVGVLPDMVVLGVLTHIVCDTGLVITAALGVLST